MKEKEKKDSSFVDFRALEMEFRLRGLLQYVGTYCQYVPYVPRVRSRRTKTFSIFLWRFARLFVILRSGL